jgi:hypothetical protein
MGTGGSFPGVKRPGREADHSPPASAEVKRMLIYTSTLAYFTIRCYRPEGLRYRQRFQINHKKAHNPSIRKLSCMAELVSCILKKKQVCCLTVKYSLGEVCTAPFEESKDVSTHKREVKTCTKQPRKKLVWRDLAQLGKPDHCNLKQELLVYS